MEKVIKSSGNREIDFILLHNIYTIYNNDIEITWLQYRSNGLSKLCSWF